MQLCFVLCRIREKLHELGYLLVVRVVFQLVGKLLHERGILREPCVVGCLGYKLLRFRGYILSLFFLGVYVVLHGLNVLSRVGGYALYRFLRVRSVLVEILCGAADLFKVVGYYPAHLLYALFRSGDIPRGLRFYLSKLIPCGFQLVVNCFKRGTHIGALCLAVVDHIAYLVLQVAKLSVQLRDLAVGKVPAGERLYLSGYAANVLASVNCAGIFAASEPARGASRDTAHVVSHMLIAYIAGVHAALGYAR